MAVPVSFKLKGADDLHRQFDKLGGTISRKIGKSAVGKAMKPVIKRAKNRTPVNTGLLKRSIGSKQYRHKKTGSIIAAVGARINIKESKLTRGALSGAATGVKQRPSLYHHLVEFGSTKTATWELKPDKAKALHIGGGGYLAGEGAFRAKAVHPGFRGQPHIARAFNPHKKAVTKLLMRKLWTGIRLALKEAR